jgi:two-component system KDP operon response regulator KdpE
MWSKMNSPQILIIDDEVQIRNLLNITLQSNDYKVTEAATGKEGLIKAANHPPDLILLDLGLPDTSGHQVLKELREWYTSPVMILSVQSSEDDIVMALDEGANDYLVKPFRTGELLARIRSALRRSINRENEPIIDCGELQIDLASRIVRKNNTIVKLTSTEYTLLTLLAKNDSKVLTHKSILKIVWGPAYWNETQYLRVFIAQLRKKIESNPNQPKYIITEAGVGYRFMAKE